MGKYGSDHVIPETNILQCRRQPALGVRTRDTQYVFHIGVMEHPYHPIIIIITTITMSESALSVDNIVCNQFVKYLK